jgi:CheY-like chemotaxis protein
MNFLIVDDSPINRGLMEQMLKQIVRESITMAEDGEQAVELYKELRQNKERIVIFLDINMPKMNGIEALKALRKLETDGQSEPAVVFIVTNYDQDNSEYLCRMLGANAFMTKPVLREPLLKEMRRQLGSDDILLVEDIT